MPTRFRIPLLAATIVLLFASCTKTNKQGRYAPKDAAFALHIDAASLSSKLAWNDIKQNVLFQQLYADTAIPAFVKQALDNPENSGIDIKADILFFGEKDSIGGVFAITGTIKDAEKFKLFCMDLSNNGHQDEKDDVNFITKGDICVGWNKERFLFVVDEPDFGHSKYEVPSPDQPRYKDMFIVCNTLFHLDESNSLGENEKFTTLVKKTGDMHFWVNAEEMNKSAKVNFKLPMVDLNKFSAGSITTATVNFENGKILIDTKSYAGKEMTDLYKKNSGKNFDEEMIKRLPTKDVAAVFALGYNPAAINDLIKVFGLEGFTPLVPKFTGFSIDEFIKANKGDLMIAIGDFKTKKDSSFITKDSMGMPTIHGNLFNIMPDITFATSVGDKDAFNKLIKAGEKFGAPFLADLHIAYNTDGKYFALSNSKETVDKYFDKANKNNFDFLSKISGNPVGGYVNMQYILKSMESNASKDSVGKAAYDASLKTWDNIFIKGGNYDDGGITQSIEINLMDKTTNSLKQLNLYLGLVGKFKIQENKKEQAEIEREEANYLPSSLMGNSTKTKK